MLPTIINNSKEINVGFSNGLISTIFMSQSPYFCDCVSE